MPQWGVFVFCAATGFIVSGVIGSFYQLVTNEAPDFLPNKATALGNATAVVMAMFAGPFILVRKIYNGLKTREMAAGWAVAVFAVAWIWSVCAGIFYLSLVV